MPAKKRGRRPTNAELSEETIARLLSTAQQEFGGVGYAAASVERIAERSGLTKGAVYYHFGNKEGLFEAVLRSSQRTLVQRIEQEAEAAGEPVEAVIAGCQAFVAVASDEQLRRIILVDGPAVLGWAKWRQIDGEFGLGSLKEGLEVLEGRPDLDLEVTAHLISGALNEAALYVADSHDPAAATVRVSRSLGPWLRALLGPVTLVAVRG